MIKHVNIKYLIKSIIGGAGLGLAVSGLLSFFPFLSISATGVSIIVFISSSIVALYYIYKSVFTITK